MQLAAEGPDQLGQPALVRGVDVLVVGGGHELDRRQIGERQEGGAHLASRPFLFDSLEPVDHLGFFFACQDAYACECSGVCDRTADVSGVHALVVSEGLVEGVHPIGRVSPS